MTTSDSSKVALVTGAAKRIGAATVQALHHNGYNIVVHYGNSSTEAELLTKNLNMTRANSATAIQADLLDIQEIKQLADKSVAKWGRLDLLVNNASSFYPTPLAEATEEQWHDLLGSNLKAPFFLSQAVAPSLSQRLGAIINITDIHADRPLVNHPIYSIAKAGNTMLTKALAKELAPTIRVNGVAPGNILWPAEDNMNDTTKTQILARIPLEKQGKMSDIVATILFLADSAPYITGQIITVDGGKTLLA